MTKAFLKTAITAALVSLSGVALAQSAAPTNAAPNPYQSITDWAKLPAGRTMGAAAGVAIDPDGKSVWVAERCAVNSCFGSTLDPIMKFDANGNMVRSFGGGMFIFPHAKTN